MQNKKRQPSAVSCQPHGRSGHCQLALIASLAVVGLFSGCAKPDSGGKVFYCDGAGWYASAGSVKSGLRAAGYRDKFKRFSWSSFLGPGHDHLVVARSDFVARRLSRWIEKARAEDPDGPVYVMGLSAGTAIVLSALEQLGEGVEVEHVVLFSPSVSAQHDLTKAMSHVRGNLYATCSPHDGILKTLVINADGGEGRPAGRSGFRLPRGASREAYQRVINVPWKPAYLAYGWRGGHTGVCNARFVESVIAPRVLNPHPHPLDLPVVGGRTSARVEFQP